MDNSNMGLFNYLHMEPFRDLLIRINVENSRGSKFRRYSKFRRGLFWKDSKFLHRRPGDVDGAHLLELNEIELCYFAIPNDIKAGIS